MHRLVIAVVTLIGLTGAAFLAAHFLFLAAATDRAAALAPANSALYVNVYLQPSTGQQMNLGGLIGRLPGFEDDASLDEKVDQVVQNLLSGTGIDYREQVKPWLGNQVALAAWPTDGDATTPTTVIDRPSGPLLSSSPGRVDPTNPAFNSSRKPLAGEFRMHGKKVFVIANHFSSKGGDDPLFGRFQPPVRSSEVARHAQAQVVNDFVDDIKAADSTANVIVLGDINDFEFSETVHILEGGVLSSLMHGLPQSERYSYVFEGNSQSLDHILMSSSLTSRPFEYDSVHVNAEFADQASDHEPRIARFQLPAA